MKYNKLLAAGTSVAILTGCSAGPSEDLSNTTTPAATVAETPKVSSFIDWSTGEHGQVAEIGAIEGADHIEPYDPATMKAIENLGQLTSGDLIIVDCYETDKPLAVQVTVRDAVEVVGSGNVLVTSAAHDDVKNNGIPAC